MTLIECFTDSHMDNIAVCLGLRPEKLLLVGEKEAMRQPAEKYHDLLRQRGIATKIILSDVTGKDLSGIRSVFEKHLAEEAECILDLTGGDELVIMAAGAALAGLDSRQRKAIRVQKFDYSQGRILDCLHGNRPLPHMPGSLSIRELIWLSGGDILPDAWQPATDSRPGELEGIWRIVAEDPKGWNRDIMVLNEFERRDNFGETISLDLEKLQGDISHFSEKEEQVRTLLDKLHRQGIIDDRSSRNRLEYTYRSPLLRYCTLKAGNALEVKTLLEARAMQENGSRFFGDSRMSVSIDWDGDLTAGAQHLPDTRNEIDVLLMHGNTPLFISCKNGTIGEEELYKLHTVAGRFGGPHARKMLIATDLEQKSVASNRSLVQRAWDMDIFLVTDAAELSSADWKELFRLAVQ